MDEEDVNRIETPPPPPPPEASPAVPPPEESMEAAPVAGDYDDIENEEGGLEAGGNSLPDPHQLIHGSAQRTSDCWTTAMFFMLIAFLGAAVVGISLGATADKRKGNDGGSNQFVGNNPGADKKREDQLISYFVENNINKLEDFNNPVGPQKKAINFLAADDKRRLAIPKGGVDTDDGYALLTRYVMSIVYYALNGKSWRFEMLFLSDHDTCEWFEVFPGSLGQVGVLCHEQTRKIVGLSFINNNLQGKLPVELGYLTTITYLESIGNGLQETIPTEIAGLTDLRTLVMAGGNLSGPLPAWVSSLNKLEFLYFSNNAFTGTIPNGWTNLQDLAVLGLDDNALNGPLDVVWQLPRMEYLYLEDNQFQGQLPTSIKSAMPLLIDFDVSTNQLGGPLPDDLFQLATLEVLDLHANSFSGPIPTNIPQNRMLSFIAMFGNSLTGTIPQSLGNLEAVRHLDLAGNSIQGTIPATLNKMVDMEYLFLANNPFTQGPIPIFMYNYANITELSLKGTNRNEGLSDLMGLWKKMTLLDLDNNALTGTIPLEIGLMENLQFLLLQQNQLDGAVPDELADLANLRVFMLDRNQLSGTLDSTCAKSFEVSTADCDEVPCSCCTFCCEDGGDCHTYDLVSNIAPTWELSYTRQFFQFGNDRINVGDDDILALLDSP